MCALVAGEPYAAIAKNGKTSFTQKEIKSDILSIVGSCNTISSRKIHASLLYLYCPKLSYIEFETVHEISVKDVSTSPSN